MRRLPIILVLGAIAGAALGASPEVRQAGRKFAPDRLTVARGTTVRFVNDEKIVHHAFVNSSDFSADTGDIEPGKTKEIAFDRAGSFDVRCAIHPQMRLRVDVRE